MNIRQITALYFSPTGGTEGIARFLAEALARRLEVPLTTIDVTTPEARQKDYRFAPDELALIATPVYAGRIPNKILPDFAAHILGSGDTPAIPLCVFGNRSVDEALRELALLLEGNGFRLAGAGAFVCRHAFSDAIGTGRPDDADRAQMASFAAEVADKLSASEALPLLELDRRDIGPYYTPLKEDGTPARFLKAKPLTDPDRCTHCGLCAQVCPMGSIDKDTAEATGLCIKCHACVRRCPAGAKSFTDPDLLSHKTMLKQNYTRRAEHTVLI